MTSLGSLPIFPSSDLSERKMNSAEGIEKEKTWTSPSFVHTTAGSFPLHTDESLSFSTASTSMISTLDENSRWPQENSTSLKVTESKLSADQMLQDVLAVCARLNSENAKLETEKKTLEDNVALLKQLNECAALGDPSLADAAISTLRGRLLESARKDHSELQKQHADNTVQIRALQYQLDIEKKAAIKAKEKEQVALSRITDVAALSEARARAVDRLDSELVSTKAVMLKVDKENVDLHDKVRMLEMRLKDANDRAEKAEAEARLAREAMEKLTERVVNQGMDLRVMKAQMKHDDSGPVLRRMVLDEPPRLSDPSLAPRTPASTYPKPCTSPLNGMKSSAENDVDYQELFKRREHELLREISTLRKEHQRSTMAPPVTPQPRLLGDITPLASSNMIDALRERLSQAITELKLTAEDRARERTQFNALLASYAARIKSLDARLKKDAQLKREIKYYKYIAKKSQAELAASIAKDRARCCEDRKQRLASSPTV